MLKEKRELPRDKKGFAVTAYDARQARFDYNVGIVKKYGDVYKVSYHKYVLKKGSRISRSDKGTVNDKKLENNIRRARTMIKEYALCNEWQYFVTLTLDKEKRDRYNINEYIKALGQRIRNLNKTRDSKITYLLIPERHKDGAWHMHGFINGLNDDDVKKTVIKGRRRDVYHWLDYEDKFGFSDMEIIESKEKATSYITKYVSKEMANSISDVNAKTYYCSRGLKKAEVIKRGTVSPKYNPSYKAEIDGLTVYSECWTNDSVMAELCVYDSTMVDTWQYMNDVENIPFGDEKCGLLANKVEITNRCFLNNPRQANW